jgi:hypothetical protein
MSPLYTFIIGCSLGYLIGMIDAWLMGRRAYKKNKRIRNKIDF